MAEPTNFIQMMFQCCKGAITGIEIYRGAQLGLFEQLAKYDAPKMSQEIADDLQLKERYVREWLAVMVTAGIVELDKDGTRYILPEDRHAAFCPPSDGMAQWCGVIPLLCDRKIQDRMNECFKKDGPPGVPFDYYDKFSQWKSECAERDYRWEKLKVIIEEVPGMMEKLESGLNVIELGCGEGAQSCIIAEHFPNSTIMGFDINETAIANANTKAQKKGLKNVTFEVGDATDLKKEWYDKFDYAFCIDVVHDIWGPSQVLAELYKALKPGGEFSMIDVNLHSNVKDNIGDPKASFCYGASLNYCLTTALNHPESEGVGIGWGKERMIKDLTKAGFKNAEQKSKSETGDIHILSQK